MERSNARRKALERLAMAMILGINQSDIAHTQSIIYLRMWQFPNEPWSVSGLANVTGIDRATVREHLKRIPSSRLHRTKDGVTLTEEGLQVSTRQIIAFYRQIPPQARQKLRRYFGRRFKGREPMRKLFGFLADFDRCTRGVPDGIAYKAALTCIDMLGPRGKQWSISEISDTTGYTYQSIHKDLSRMVKEGRAKKVGKLYQITSKGRRRTIYYFVCHLKNMDLGMYRTITGLLFFNNPPPARIVRENLKG